MGNGTRWHAGGRLRRDRRVSLPSVRCSAQGTSGDWPVRGASALGTTVALPGRRCYPEAVLFGNELVNGDQQALLFKT